MSHRSVATMLKIVLFTSIIFLVRYSSGLYAHSYFDGMDKSCRESSSCSGNRSTTFLITRNCQCDIQCATYGDCCQDSPHFKPSHLQECVTAGDWNTAGDYKDDYYMVTSCPSSWMEEATRSRCENYIETIRSQPILGHPVTSNATNITYANIHCARCNDDLLISTMIRWKLAVTCDEKLSLPVPDIDTVIKDAIYEDFKFKPKFANISYHTCKLCVWRPFSLLRRCHKKTVVTCPPSWQNETVREQCEAYTSLVFKLKQTPYRNPHCATCNNVSDKRMECEKEDIEPETFFPTLFDVFDESSNVVGQKPLCPNKNESYDPIAQKCRQTAWSVAEQIGHYGLEKCYGNISSCGINNCSIFVTIPDKEYELNDNFTVTVFSHNKVYGNGEFRKRDDGHLELCADYNCSFLIFKPEEYELNDNFTVTVFSHNKVYVHGEFRIRDDGHLELCADYNCSFLIFKPEEYELNDNFTVTVFSHNKVYGNGEFRIRDDGHLELCTDYLIMEEKFNGFTRYLSFLGLGVSISFLFLHLVAFATNPALRNLSDKSLASLCTALILAYGAFIIGQLLTNGDMACKVTAVVTYYSFLSTFSWLLLIAFDVWYALRLSVKHLRILSAGSRPHAFITYSTLGWLIFPVIFTSAALSMDYSQVEPTFRPGFGEHNCWFGNRKALLVFFVIPVGVTMVLNFYFFVSSARMICTSTMSPSNKSSSTQINHKLFARLSLLMGLTWIVGIIAGYLDLDIVWYIFVALNAFQGLFIFLAFTWTKKVRRGYRTQVSCDTKSNYVENSASCCSWSRSTASHTDTTELRRPLKTKGSLFSCSDSSGHD